MKENNQECVKLSELIPYLQAANLKSGEDREFILPKGRYLMKIRTHRDNIIDVYTMKDELEGIYIRSSDDLILQFDAITGGTATDIGFETRIRAWFNKDQLAEATYNARYPTERVRIPLQDDLTLMIEKSRV